MSRRFLVAAIAGIALASSMVGAAVAAPAPPGFTKRPVTFTVTNPSDPLHGAYRVSGFLMRPAGCANKGVLLALHGLSYGQWAWDFPLRPERYSVARALARRGYATIAVDRLGYGRSGGKGMADRPNGYTLSVESYAAVTSQILTQIRAGTYGGPAFGRVGLIGHSAGAEVAELTAGLYPDQVDALIATAYTHEPFVNNDWLVRHWVPDNVSAAQSDYTYFQADPKTRATTMHNLANTDPDVVRRDTALVNLTPSGEILSIGAQPSRFVLPTIATPVLLLLAEKDTLFPGAMGESEMLHFASASDKTLVVVPNAGHAYMLERNAPAVQRVLADWLDKHRSAVPAC